MKNITTYRTSEIIHLFLYIHRKKLIREREFRRLMSINMFSLKLIDFQKSRKLKITFRQERPIFLARGKILTR